MLGLSLFVSDPPLQFPDAVDGDVEFVFLAVFHQDAFSGEAAHTGEVVQVDDGGAADAPMRARVCDRWGGARERTGDCFLLPSPQQHNWLSRSLFPRRSSRSSHTSRGRLRPMSTSGSMAECVCALGCGGACAGARRECESKSNAL